MSDEQLDALLHGWLTAVDENGCAAQLRDYTDNSIPLRFPESLRDDVLRLATRYVEIRGTGWLNGNDRWTSVDVAEIVPDRSCNEPFDVEAFLNNPNPKRFDPAKLVTASEPFDVDELIRGIREARNVPSERPE